MKVSNAIENMAVRIACAELANGLRNYWIYEMDDEKLRKIAAASVKLAKDIRQAAKQ